MAFDREDRSWALLYVKALSNYNVDMLNKLIRKYSSTRRDLLLVVFASVVTGRYHELSEAELDGIVTKDWALESLNVLAKSNSSRLGLHTYTASIINYRRSK